MLLLLYNNICQTGGFHLGVAIPYWCIIQDKFCHFQWSEPLRHYGWFRMITDNTVTALVWKLLWKCNASCWKILKFQSRDNHHVTVRRFIQRLIDMENKEIGLATVYRIWTSLIDVCIVTVGNFWRRNPCIWTNTATSPITWSAFDCRRYVEFGDDSIEARQRIVANISGSI